MSRCLALRLLLPLVAGLTLLTMASCGAQTQTNSSSRGPSDSSALPGTTGSPGSTTNPGASGDQTQANGAQNPTIPENVRANSGVDDRKNTLSGSSSGTPSDSNGSAGEPAPLGVAGPSAGSAEVAGAVARQATIEITSENGSTVAGTATLSDLGNGSTRVMLLVTGSSGDHPAHIHDGVCPSVNPEPKWPLNDVQNGSSSTDVGASLDEIMSGSTAVNVHASPQDETAIACGTITAPA